MKAQLKGADRSGARLALILGEKEAELGVVTVRDLTAGDQEEVVREEVLEAVRRRVT